MRRGALLACGVLVAPACALHAPPLPALPRHAAVLLSLGAPPGVAAVPRHRARLALPSMHAAAEDGDPDAARLGRGARLRKKLRQLVFCVVLTTGLRLSPARATTAGVLDSASLPAVSVKAPASAQRMAMDGGRRPYVEILAELEALLEATGIYTSRHMYSPVQFPTYLLPFVQEEGHYR